MPDDRASRAVPHVNKTDLSLILSAFSAFALIVGPTAALVIAAFIAGRLSAQPSHPSP